MEHLKKRLNQLLEKKIELDNYLAKQLPKSILQEAIQGKLVPQIAEEGTAQELLEQIKVEKQKLVKEGKLKKSSLNGSVIFQRPSTASSYVLPSLLGLAATHTTSNQG